MRASYRDFLILIAMSIIGIASATTIIIELDVLHTSPPFCTIPGSSQSGIQINCMKVLLSKYSTVMGVSLDMLAALWFVINILLVVSVVFMRRSIAKKTFEALFAWRFFGLLLVPYLIYLELFVVKAICIYCTIMHGAIIIDFIIITYLVFAKNSRIRKDLGI
ncbi:MAG: vitamin K epoxide reductase family protein [Candidatus Micrarchaeaceae archaeon]